MRGGDVGDGMTAVGVKCAHPRRRRTGLLRVRGRGLATNFLGCPHGFERARDHLGRARAVHVVGRLRFEQLRMGQDDPQLIVQPVEKNPQLSAGQTLGQ